MAKLAPYTRTSSKYVTDAPSVDYSALQKEDEDRRRAQAVASQAQQQQQQDPAAATMGGDMAADPNRSPVGQSQPTAPGGHVQLPEPDRYNTNFGGLQGQQAVVTQQDFGQDPGRNIGYDPVAEQLGANAQAGMGNGFDGSKPGFVTDAQQSFAGADPSQAGMGGADQPGVSVEQGGDLEPLVWQNLNDILSMERRDTSQAEEAANWESTGQMRALMGSMAAQGFGASGAMGRMGGVIEGDRQQSLADINRQADMDLFGQQTAALNAQLPYQKEQSREDRERMIFEILNGELNPEDAAGGGGGEGDAPFGSEFNLMDPGTWTDNDIEDGSVPEQIADDYESGGLLGAVGGAGDAVLDWTRLFGAEQDFNPLNQGEGEQLLNQGWEPMTDSRTGDPVTGKNGVNGRELVRYQNPETGQSVWVEAEDHSEESK